MMMPKGGHFRHPGGGGSCPTTNGAAADDDGALPMRYELPMTAPRSGCSCP
ncbi:MAG: hypothetical protein PUB55_04090 [Bacteroidales bacterium]|nr:hypothetical protein [Bacteroidales bacterium]